MIGKGLKCPVGSKVDNSVAFIFNLWPIVCYTVA